MFTFRRTSHGPAEAGHYVRFPDHSSPYCFRQAGHRQPSYFDRISARAASVSLALLHQHPDSDSSHAKGCPHDSQVPGFLMMGPEGPHPIDTFMSNACEAGESMRSRTR